MPAIAAEQSLDRPPTLNLTLESNSCEKPPALTSLNLHEAIQIALCHAPDIQQAAISVEESIENLRGAQSKYYPTLQARTDANRTGQEIKHASNNRSTHTYTGSTSLGLNWLLFDSGQRSAQYDTAQAQLEAASYKKLLANRNQALTVAHAYYQASSAQNSATAVQEAAVRAEKNFNAAQRLREQGAGSIADELLAKVAWQRNLVDYETKVTAAKNATLTLASNMGLPSQTFIDLASENHKPIAISAGHVLNKQEESDLTQKRSDYIFAAIKNHPRIAIARANIQASEAEAKAIQAQYQPSLSLQADRYLRITPPSSNMDKQRVNGWSVGLSLNIPIFDGGAARHATGAAQARTRISREAERTAWLEEELTLLTDLNHLTSANQKFVLLKETEDSAEQAYRSAKIRYQQGVGTAVELLKAQDDLASIQQAKIDVQHELWSSQFRVAIAIDFLPEN